MAGFDSYNPTFEARYHGTCARCGLGIRPGERVRYDDENDDELNHERCPRKKPACPQCFLVHGSGQEECDG